MGRLLRNYSQITNLRLAFYNYYIRRDELDPIIEIIGQRLPALTDLHLSFKGCQLEDTESMSFLIHSLGSLRNLRALVLYLEFKNDSSDKLHIGLLQCLQNMGGLRRLELTVNWKNKVTLTPGSLNGALQSLSGLQELCLNLTDQQLTNVEDIKVLESSINQL